MMTNKAMKEATYNSIKNSNLWKGYMMDGNNIIFWSEFARNELVYDDNDRKVMSITTRYADGHQTIIRY